MTAITIPAPTRPAMDRLRLRIIKGTLAMLEAQLHDLPATVRGQLVFGLPVANVTGFRLAVAALYETTVDAPPPPPEPPPAQAELA